MDWRWTITYESVPGSVLVAASARESDSVSREKDNSGEW